MGPKQKGGGGGASKQKGNATEEVEETLQAVVFADTFETRFEPFTLEKPRCLLPLANTPLIEYTLEFLANAGVQDVFLYGGAHSNLLEKHISTSRWKASSSPFKKLTFLKSTSTSVGDVMRDLDGKHLITGDFIAVSGDVISNFPIDEVLAKHRSRRQTDRNAIMTMVLREAGTQHRTKSSSISPVFVVDPTKDRCLHYEEIYHYDKESPARLTIDTEILTTCAEIDIRQDLIDCNIDICTPDVLSLWSDSFDYQAPRKHFLYGVLKDYELNGKTIHTHIIKEHYAARVRNLKAYDAVTKDIISRWTYPLCPDTNLLPGHTYELRRGSIYQEQGVILARSCVVGRRTVIGQGTSIGDRTTVTNSVLGRNCKIGKNVILDGAYIWDGVVIGDNTEIRQAIVAEGVTVGDNCRVEPNVLLSFGVKISNGVTVKEGTRVTVAPREDGSVPATESEIVGAQGRGYEYVEEEDEDEEDDRSESSGLVYNMAKLSLSTDSISTLSSEISADDDYFHGQRSDSFGTSLSEDEDHDHFQHDASNNLYDSLRDGVSSDVVALELVSLRMSTNASDYQVRRAVASSFMKRISQLVTESGKSAGDAVHDVFSRYKDVVDRCLFDKNKEQKTDQIDLLLQIQQDLVHRAKGDTILLFAAKELYDLDIIEEEAFEAWWADERSSATEELKKVRVQTQQFVDWLANASEEEDDDDDDDDEDEDEDDDEDDDDEEEDSEEEEKINPVNTFTTPPNTRKRKAVEEAATSGDDHRCDHISATTTGLTKNKKQLKTLPLERSVQETTKAKSEEEDVDQDLPFSPLSKKGASIVTPTTTTRSMDSDDDFMTDVSSREDFLDTQDSEDESLDFGDDLDGGFSYDKDLVQKTKKPYEVDFKVLSPGDIDREQNYQINEVSSVLGLPPESSGILLRFARWNREKLIESYMDRSDELLEEAGLGQSFETNPRTETVPGFMCSICCEDGDDLETYAMRCDHRFCVDCFRHYLSQKIKEEGEAARIQCPQDNCHRIVDSKSLNLLVADDLKDRYKTLLTRTYVDDKDNLKWCPAPNCEFAIDCGVKARDLNKIVPTVHCSCKHSFCFGCSLNDHQPPPCSLVKMWMKKCEDDSETANWISANTKECPKCLSTIEKNGGCNHMTCRKCKYEFCWMCMGLWSEHGTSWYNCNRYTEKSGSEARDAQAKSRASLERYLHYYNRYANHEQSAKLDKDLYLKTEKKMTSLQSQSGMSWIEVQFLDTASQALQQCRQTLKWTYAFAYYLARNNLTEIFEDNQKDLEMAVESLSEMFEKPIAELAELKVDILDKTAYCNKRRVILLSDTAENLKQREWKFNVDLS